MLNIKGLDVICTTNAGDAIKALDNDDDLRGKITLLLCDYRLFESRMGISEFMLKTQGCWGTIPVQVAECPGMFSHQNWLNTRRRFVEKMKLRELKVPGERSPIDSNKSPEVELIENTTKTELFDFDDILLEKYRFFLEDRVGTAISYESETLVLKIIIADSDKPVFELALFDMNIPADEVDIVVNKIKTEIDDFLSKVYPHSTSNIDSYNINVFNIKYIWANIMPGENFEKDLDELDDDFFQAL